MCEKGAEVGREILGDRGKSEGLGTWRVKKNNEKAHVVLQKIILRGDTTAGEARHASNKKRASQVELGLEKGRQKGAKTPEL